MSLAALTLDVCHTLLKDLVKSLGVLKLFLDLGNNGVGQFLLLASLDLSLVTHPRVQNSLSLSGDGGLLLELVSLGLELSSLL